MRDETARHRFDAVIDMVAFQPAEAESLLRAFGGRVKQIVVCSTVCVYGGPMTRVPAADDEPHRPVTQYGRNKSAIERTLLAANGRDGLHTTVLRPSFTTGEGHTLGGAVMFDDSTLERFRQGRPIVVHDDGRTPWAIAHVSDVARGFVGALLNERAYGQSYHVTSDEHTTWDGVYRAMAEAAGAPGRSPFVHIPTGWLAERGPAPHRRHQLHLPVRLDVRQCEGGARSRLSHHRAAGRDVSPADRLDGGQSQSRARRGRPLPGSADRRVREEATPRRTGSVNDFNPWGNETAI